MEHDENTATTEDEDFAAGFAETATAPADQPAAPTGEQKPEADDDSAAPAPAAAPAAAAAPTPAPAPADDTTAPQADPFAGLPPAVRDLLAEIPTLRSRTELAERQAKEFGGRVSKLQSDLDRMRTPAAAPAPRASLPKVQALREQGLDEIADAIEAAAEAAPKPQTTTAPAPPAAAPAQDDPPEIRTLTKIRPTWAEDVESTDFKLWLARQPQQYQAALNASHDPADIVNALSAFDTSRAPHHPPAPAPARQARMAAAVVPQGDGRRAPRGPQPADEDAEFEAGFHGRSP